VVARQGTVLIVEDEEAIRDLVAFHLETAGFQVIQAEDGEEGLRQALDEAPDLVLLDLMLPRLDGVALLRALRRLSRVPVIMLTARTEEADRVRGLELGADDYVGKPFSPRELVARVKAVLRRTDPPTDRLAAGGVEIDLQAHRCYVQGRERELTLTEFGLLQTLMERPGQVLTREMLLEKVWGYDYYGDARTVDVHVRHLREKVEAEPSRPRLIETVRGVGYRFAP
jgi:phosphate regulon transcriptional regulator PhoB